MSAMTKPTTLPMNRGFEVIEREGALGMTPRVYGDQSHFATRPNARRPRKGGGK